MRLFLDTSALVKLYHYEEHSDKLDNFISSNKIESLVISEISIIGYLSAIQKKLRLKELKIEQAKILIESFKADERKFIIINMNSEILKISYNLILKYGSNGLRTLDSIQFASAKASMLNDDIFVAFDKRLNQIVLKENIKILQ